MIKYVIVHAYAVEDPMVIVASHKLKPDFLKGVVNLPGGKLEEGEGPVEAAIRELKEETGLEPVEEYDPSVYCPSEYCGYIFGNSSIIHCVKVPVCGRQPIIPGPEEKEKVEWRHIPELLEDRNLMPNLRLAIPLMATGAKNWAIRDQAADWRENPLHTVNLSLGGLAEVSVQLRGMPQFLTLPSQNSVV